MRWLVAALFRTAFVRGFLDVTVAEPLAFFASGASRFIELKTSDDGLGGSILLKLENEHVTVALERGKREMIAPFFDFRLLGIAASAAGHNKRLFLERKRFHFLIEHCDKKGAIRESHLAVKALISAEFQNAPAVWTDLLITVGNGVH